MKRIHVRIIYNFLNFTGVNVTDSKVSCSHLVRLCTVLCLLLCTHLSLVAYAYINRREFDESITIVAYTGATILLAFVVLKFIHTKQWLKFLLKTIDENVFEYSDEANIGVRYDWFLDEENTVMVYGSVLCYQSFGFALAGISPIIGYTLGVKKTFLLYPGWTPWTIDSFASFVITYIYQLVTAGCVFWIYYLTQLFVIFIVTEFLRQNQRLCQALSTIDERTRKLLLMTTTTDGNCRGCGSCEKRVALVFTSQLCQSIKHHQMLVTLFRVFKSWFELVFFVELTLGITSFAFVFYNLLHATSYETYLSLMGASFVSISSLFTRCMAGEVFTAMNKRTVETIFYDINWFDLDAKNRHLVCMFHHYVQRRSLDLYAFSIFKASFFTFTGIIRTTYSYFSILRASLRNS